ncbi:5'-nucleotidase, cytosolic III [Phytophthora pseudosyringae]|uniref:5'-nucleotidase n=1 Tax=Phytophthora pseudosyringae TaxID=221518 RepID=A0A8T1W2C6_9STRA|nr:5'-nucleotidase, cytosolic III [Phytophthora pseudosyringae]
MSSSPSRLLPLCAATSGSLLASRWYTRCSGTDVSAAGPSIQAHSYSDGHQRRAPRMIIGDPDAFARKMRKFTKDGPEQLLVIADFDRTLTPYYKQRSDPKTPLEQENSSHGLLMTSTVLHPRVCVGEQELFARFYPVEMSPTLSAEEKLPFMEQWWDSAHALLIEYKLTKKQIDQAVSLGSLSFRQGFHPLFKLLHDQQVPTLIFSAGLYDVIHAALEQEFAAERKRNGGSTETKSNKPSNVHVVSNMMRFDASGVINGFDGTVIHSLNKTARVLLDSSFWEEYELKKRRNVLLLGDSRGDVRMSEGLDADEIIRVGFLNVHVDEALNEYLELYDVVFTHDVSLVPVQMLIEQITASKGSQQN